jgi:hypothetical protein
VKAAILNSRQNLRPVGSDRWIINSSLAINSIIENNQILLGSVGMNTWEFLVYLASKNQIRQVIYLSIEESQNQGEVIDYYTGQFRLSSNLINWRFINIRNIQSDRIYFQKERDRLIINEADIIYPIALRPDSTLASLLGNIGNSKANIVEEYKTDYDNLVRSCKIEIDRKSLNSNIDGRLGDFIIHWTRTSNNPWPGEIFYDYYNAIAHSGDYYPRSAYNTLIRILTEKKIRASSRHYRKGISAVAFSELRPSDAINLMKWRARYREMTFEPYGIAIRKTAAEKMGIRKVIYGGKEKYANLDLIDRPYFQSIGTKGFWVPEREWRYSGDINLSLICPDDIEVIVCRENEIHSVKNCTEFEVLALFS